MDNKAIAERLVRLRGSRTQREVADAIGVTANALSMYETGQRIPRDDIKVRLAKYYRSNVAKIFYS